MPDPELVDAVEAFLEVHSRFVAVREAAHGAIEPAFKSLREAYRDVVALQPGISGLLAKLRIEVNGQQVSGQTLAAAELAAVHPPATPRTLAWNRTLERELRDDVKHGLHVPSRRFDQIQRMRARGELGKRPAPATPRKLAIGPVNGGDHVCAICARDHWTIAGEDLVLEDTDAPVCWLCGDEHDPRLTAQLLAKAVDDAERSLARAHSYLEHWLALLDALGVQQAVEDVKGDYARYKRHVREVKAAGLGHAETWFTSPAN